MTTIITPSRYLDKPRDPVGNFCEVGNLGLLGQVPWDCRSLWGLWEQFQQFLWVHEDSSISTQMRDLFRASGHS